MIHIRAATDRDVCDLPGIEQSAGALFRTWAGLEWIADDDVQSPEQHRALIAHGVALVAEDEAHGLVGFLNGEVAPDALHIWQVAVHHDRQGCGIGRRLMEAVELLAVQRGIEALTLTTFRDVPWNEPSYQRLGFRTLRDDELNPRLKGILQREGQAGLPLDQRCAMRKDL